MMKKLETVQNGCKTLRMCLMPPKCTLKNGQDGQFYDICILPQQKKLKNTVTEIKNYFELQTTDWRGERIGSVNMRIEITYPINRIQIGKNVNRTGGAITKDLMFGSLESKEERQERMRLKKVFKSIMAKYFSKMANDTRHSKEGE